jgi:hypothetical protein
VKTIANTPTRLRDYALLSGIYGATLGGIAMLAKREDRFAAPMPASELLWGAAAVFGLAQPLVHEKVEGWLRAPFVSEIGEDQAEASHEPRGSGVRYAVGELVSCSRCSGAWIALGLTGLHVAAPRTARVVTRTFALSGANDFLESGFSLLRERANTETARER